MPELILNGLQISTGQMCQRGGAVAQVVQADGGQPGGGHQGSQAVGEEPGVEWVAVPVGEHVSGVLPSAGSGVAFLALSAGVLSQHGDGVPVQGDGAGARRRFRWALENLVAGGGPGSDDHQLSVVEVESAQRSPANSLRRSPRRAASHHSA
jgi:hypothetical protein